MMAETVNFTTPRVSFATVTHGVLAGQVSFWAQTIDIRMYIALLFQEASTLFARTRVEIKRTLANVLGFVEVGSCSEAILPGRNMQLCVSFLGVLDDVRRKVSLRGFSEPLL